MPEIWDVYDVHRCKKPRTHVRGVPLDAGDYHLVVEIWTFTSDDKVLLTLRHPDKHYGNLWECTGGSAVQGEDSITAARRELLEETGLDMGKAIPTLLTTVTSHNTIYDIYAVRLNFTLNDIILQEGETVGKRLVDFSFLEDPANDAQLCTPPLQRLRTAALPFLRRFRDRAECWDMYDHSGRFLGYNRLRPIDKSEQQHPWETSLAAIAFIQDMDGRILLTQRAPHKAAGLKWGCTGGGVATGETPEIAVQREVLEEVGLDVTGQTVTLLNRFLLDGDYGKWCMYVYHVHMPFALTDIIFQPEEVVDAKLVAPSELEQHPLVAGILRRDPTILSRLSSAEG